LTTYSRSLVRGCAGGNILARCEHESLHARHAHGSNARPKCVANVTGSVLSRQVVDGNELADSISSE
jgi:hypothetical protein